MLLIKSTQEWHFDLLICFSLPPLSRSVSLQLYSGERFVWFIESNAALRKRYNVEICKLWHWRVVDFFRSCSTDDENVIESRPRQEEGSN